MLKLNHLTGFGSGAAAAGGDVTSYAGDDVKSYLSIPDHADWVFGSGSFTIEFWIYLNDASAQQGFVNSYSNSTNLWTFNQGVYGTGLVFVQYESNVQTILIEQGEVTLVTGVWTHIALVRNGNDYNIYIDGTSVASGTDATAVADFSGGLFIGSVEGALYNNLDGYMDEIRVSDTARYTTTFTPSTSQFTSDANTLLLIHGGEAYTGALTGETTQSCVALDGTGDYLSVADHADWTLGAGNFTIEAFVKFNSAAVTQSFYDQRADSSNQVNVQFTGSLTGIEFYARNAGDVKADYAGAWTPSINTWYHFAIVRNGADLEMYIDGTGITPTENTAISTNTIGDVADTLTIGQRNSASYLDGQISEFRLSDTARWTANFTPPTERYTSDANTLLLIHGDENGGGTAAFTDSGNTGHTVTPTGNAFLGNGGTFTDSGNTGHTVSENGQAQRETEQEFKFTNDGVGYSLAGGATDYLSVPDHDDWTFGSGNFTAECWMRLRAIQTGSIFQHEAASNDKWYLRFKSDIGLHFQASDTSDIVDFNQADVASWQINRWYHVAVIRGWNGNANDWAITRDGVPVATVTDASSLQGLTASLLIGRSTGAGSTLDAYLDEIRISDIARWTADFSASLPSAQYSSDANTLLLIHGGETKSGTTGSGATFTDSGNTGHTVTENGNAIESTGNLYKF